MMSPKQWWSLLAFYVSYLFFGASIFYYNEQSLETERRAVALAERIEIHALLQKYIVPSNTSLQYEILDRVSEYCEQPVTDPSEDEYVPPYIWNFYHSFFFSFIVCSTVGYGNITPNNTFGRMFLIFYALVGIPVHMILLKQLGDYFGATFVRLYNRYKQYKISTNTLWVPPKLNLIAQIAVYLTPAIIIFIFIPAVLFTYFENWDYTISIYYSFVTLTTIGFGDYVPTFQPHQERTFGIYFVFYQIFILLWFIAGIGYLVMIIGFLVDGLRSKRMKRLEHNLALNFKQTQKKIWNGVTKDVSYLRNILNEVYFLKFKPVYKDPEEVNPHFRITKSQSCPNLFMYDDDEEADKIPRINRERAFSVCSPRQRTKRSISSTTMHRIQSDSDLSHIDKEKTFATDSRRSVMPGDLLAKIVVALGGYRDNDDQKQASIHSSALGVHGFSDSQILASEQNYDSDWSIGSAKSNITPPGKQTPRVRAVSEIRIPMEESEKASREWTWSGANTQIREIEDMRSRAARKPKENLYKTSLQTKLRYEPEAVADDFPGELPTKLDGTATNKSLLSKLNPFKRKIPNMMKRHSLAPGLELDPQKYIRSTQAGRASVSSLSRNYLTQNRRPSMFARPSGDEQQDLLETTTVADLIRAIEMVHTDNAVGSSGLEEALAGMKKRKLGLDNSTSRRQSLFTLERPQPSQTMHAQTIHKPSRSRLDSTSSTPYVSSENFRGRILGDQNLFVRRPSMRPPPPYTTTPTEVLSLKPALKRRFSVRPANLDKAPGQSPSPQNTQITASSQQQAATLAVTPFQRKLSWRPMPSSLAQSNETKQYGRQKSDSTSSAKPT